MPYRAEYSAARRAAAKAYTDAAKAGPCTDCGLCYPPHVMDFDHLADKRLDVAVMVQRAYSIEAIAAEIAKCELVCSNCHRIRTHYRRNHA